MLPLTNEVAVAGCCIGCCRSGGCNNGRSAQPCSWPISSAPTACCCCSFARRRPTWPGSRCGEGGGGLGNDYCLSVVWLLDVQMCTFQSFCLATNPTAVPVCQAAPLMGLLTLTREHTARAVSSTQGACTSHLSAPLLHSSSFPPPSALPQVLERGEAGREGRVEGLALDAAEARGRADRLEMQLARWVL